MVLDDRALDKIGKFRLPTPVPPLCPRCGYNLTGLNDPLCPECGYEFDWRSVRRKARAQWLEALGLKTLPDEIEFGFRLAWIAWGLAILVLAGGTYVPWDISRIRVLIVLVFAIECLLSFCAAFLCSHIIRFVRLPVEAREELRIEVPMAKAWSGLLLAVLLMMVDLPLLGRVLHVVT